MSSPSLLLELKGEEHCHAFLRVDRQPINLRSIFIQPDHIVVLDPTLLGAIDVTSGLKQDGWILINSHQPPEVF